MTQNIIILMMGISHRRLSIIRHTIGHPTMNNSRGRSRIKLERKAKAKVEVIEC